MALKGVYYSLVITQQSGKDTGKAVAEQKESLVKQKSVTDRKYSTVGLISDDLKEEDEKKEAEKVCGSF